MYTEATKGRGASLARPTGAEARNGGYMYCSTCGNKIADDARFCPFCGAATAVGGAPAPTPAPSVSSAQGSRGDLGSQVRRARRLSLSALSPTVLGLLIAFFVLTTVAVAALLIYFNIYLPAQRQAAEQQQMEQPVEDSEEEEADAGQPTDAAAFDAKLAQYQEAQRSGWNASGADEDVAGVAALFTNTSGAANAVSGEEASWVASYAIADVNNDGMSELVVALVGPDGEYRPLAIYATDGSSVTTVAADLPSAQPRTITLRADGSVELTESGTAGSTVVMAVEQGMPVELTRFEWGLSQGALTWRYYERGQLVDEGEAGGLEEVFSHMPQTDTTPCEGLDWKSLSSYGTASE